MKQSEKIVLETLRKTTLAYLSENEYSALEKAVGANGILNLTGATAHILKTAVQKNNEITKATGVKRGDMVSWNSSGGTARGKVVRVINSGKLDVPKTNFEINAEEDDPAVLIQLYRDGKPTETQVGHKMSTLRKS
jgi:hypothetical protein